MEEKQGAQKIRFQNVFYCGMGFILYEVLSYVANILSNMGFLN